MKDSYDVIVVGAGIVGTAIAYNLARAGIKDVLLLEKNTVCSGDTAYSCAIVRTHYSNPLTCKMATIGRDVLADFPQRVGGESGFRRCGYLIFSGPDTLVEFERNVSLQRDAGADVELIDTRQALELHPLLDPSPHRGGRFRAAFGIRRSALDRHGLRGRQPAMRGRDPARHGGATAWWKAPRTG